MAVKLMHSPLYAPANVVLSSQQYIAVVELYPTAGISSFWEGITAYGENAKK